MRFKKLRISVGIALIIFILVAGNIIVLGELMKDKSTVKNLSDQNVVAITDNRKVLSQNKNNQEIKTAKNNENVNQIAQPIVESVPPSKPAIVHTKRRTRAS